MVKAGSLRIAVEGRQFPENFKADPGIRFYAERKKECPIPSFVNDLSVA